MGILKELFGTSELIEEIGEIADDLITTKEEKLILKQKIEAKILEYESKMVLIFLVVSTMILVFIDAGTIKFHVESNWVSLLELVLIAVIGSYFGGRSLEKIKRK